MWGHLDTGQSIISLFLPVLVLFSCVVFLSNKADITQAVCVLKETKLFTLNNIALGSTFWLPEVCCGFDEESGAQPSEKEGKTQY